jgi:hypothetical protein
MTVVHHPVDGRRLGWGACLTGEQQVPGADEHRGERVDVRVRGDAAPVGSAAR